MGIDESTIGKYLPTYLSQQKYKELISDIRSFPQLKTYYCQKYEDNILQGDGWDSLEVFRLCNGQKKPIQGIILSNSCDIDQSNPRHIPTNIIFSPIIKLNDFQKLLNKKTDGKLIVEDKISAIKRQEVSNYFYLPKGGTLEEDYIAKLDEAHSVPLVHYTNQNSKKKLFTLNQIGFYLFLFKLSVHFCRFHENIER